MDIVEGIRQALVEILVPEIRALRKDMDERFAKQDEKFAQLLGEIRELRGAVNVILTGREGRMTALRQRGQAPAQGWRVAAGRGAACESFARGFA